LRQAYAGLQAQLTAGLHSSRVVIDHPGSKGSGSEANWLEMLQAHLPKRYQAESAFIIDADGQQSEQIDIVLYDRQYTPELYNAKGQRIIPAEGVYAVIEVKQVLDKRTLKYASDKIASVRRLRRSSVSIVHAGGKHEPRELTPIIGAVLATANGWTPPFGKAFKIALGKLVGEASVDLGCIVEAGAFELQSNDKIETADADLALAFFFLRLLRRLQRIGTVPALDYDRYLGAIDQ
jgi:hypothetical protein